MPGVTSIGAVVGGFAVGTIARRRLRPGWLTEFLVPSVIQDRTAASVSYYNAGSLCPARYKQGIDA